MNILLPNKYIYPTRSAISLFMFAVSQDLIDKSKDVHAPLFIEAVSNKFGPIDSKAFILYKDFTHNSQCLDSV